jgi:hypothetical protein
MSRRRKADSLEALGKSLLHELVYKPHYGHVIDYKIRGEQLIIIIEKKDLTLVEGVYSQQQGGRPKGTKNRIRTKRPTKPLQVTKVEKCPDCGSKDHFYRWDATRNVCINEVHGHINILFNIYEEAS